MSQGTVRPQLSQFLVPPRTPPLRETWGKVSHRGPGKSPRTTPAKSWVAKVWGHKSLPWGPLSREIRPPGGCHPCLEGKGLPLCRL